MGCLECKVFYCEIAQDWKLIVTREIGLEDHARPGYKIVGHDRVVMKLGDVEILGQGDLIFPGSLEDTYMIDMHPPLTRIKPKSDAKAESNFLY